MKNSRNRNILGGLLLTVGGIAFYYYFSNQSLKKESSKRTQKRNFPQQGQYSQHFNIFSRISVDLYNSEMRHVAQLPSLFGSLQRNTHLESDIDISVLLPTSWLELKPRDAYDNFCCLVIEGINSGIDGRKRTYQTHSFGSDIKVSEDEKSEIVKVDFVPIVRLPSTITPEVYYDFVANFENDLWEMSGALRLESLPIPEVAKCEELIWLIRAMKTWKGLFSGGLISSAHIETFVRYWFGEEYHNTVPKHFHKKKNLIKCLTCLQKHLEKQFACPSPHQALVSSWKNDKAYSDNTSFFIDKRSIEEPKDMADLVNIVERSALVEALKDTIRASSKIVVDDNFVEFEAISDQVQAVIHTLAMNSNHGTNRKGEPSVSRQRNIISHFDFNAYASTLTKDVQKVAPANSTIQPSYSMFNDKPPGYSTIRDFPYLQKKVEECRNKIQSKPTALTIVAPNTLATYLARLLAGQGSDLYLFHKNNQIENSAMLRYAFSGQGDGNASKEGDTWLKADYYDQKVNIDENKSNIVHLYLTFSDEHKLKKEEECFVLEYLNSHANVVSIVKVGPTQPLLIVSPDNIAQLKMELREITREIKIKYGTDAISVSTAGPMPLAFALGLVLNEGRFKNFIAFERPLKCEPSQPPYIVSFCDFSK